MGQTRGAIERFWKPVLVSALNEDPEHMSVHYAGQVMRKSLLLSPGGGTHGCAEHSAERPIQPRD